jgi:hypothetical protein
LLPARAHLVLAVWYAAFLYVILRMATVLQLLP